MKEENDALPRSLEGWAGGQNLPQTLLLSSLVFLKVVFVSRCFLLVFLKVAFFNRSRCRVLKVQTSIPQVISGLLRLHGIYFHKQITCRLVEKRQKVVKGKPHCTFFVDQDVCALRYAEEGNGVVELAYPFIMIAEKGEG